MCQTKAAYDANVKFDTYGSHSRRAAPRWKLDAICVVLFLVSYVSFFPKNKARRVKNKKYN
ncbi:MAG TPA: hypothetical protein PLI57_06155 [Spirochaetota bacterium]|nr:hypothetical protein [Spirochaetota bacterium]